MTFILQANDLQFFIFTDSKSAVVAFQDPLSTNKTVQEIQILSTETRSKQKHVSTACIPTHQGTSGNEQADKMAKEAAALPTYYADILIPHSDVVAHVKGKLCQMVHTVARQSNSQLHATRTEPGNKTPHYNLNRRQQLIMTRLRTGHSNRTHSHLLENRAQRPATHVIHSITLEHVLTD
jgi:hypothetical protein